MTGDVRCAALSQSCGEPQAGTAPTAAGWICLEQPGAWGREALTGSRLDPRLGVELQRRAGAVGARVLLIRRPGRHADDRRGTSPVRRAYLAAGTPGGSWLERVDLVAPEQLLELDFAALGGARPTGLGRPVSGPLLLVCTHGRRDACCALRGRPAMAGLAAAHPEAVWECSHTSGHRFAPTGVLLPTGYHYARLDPVFGEHLLRRAAEGRVVVERCRGRSAYLPVDQVAELAVREQTGETRDVLTAAGGYVRHVDGRVWRVRCLRRDLPPARPASCGAAPSVPVVLVVVEVQRLAGVARGRQGGRR
ncbi:hypothetical protein JOF41_002501 [Saccharothrix coeruleofusca]|uniref:sucrase ferredoxin n=1 Tax=Saccharothrix coeruleofusca TaxID=33919 RepID=UPI0027DBB163|nr:sucrase ferredoxin [Saccharothrix coeruleofusca]MBP2336323.1 hypothetical protein [Saccharothrix coeruleofusca]